jgi:hypothetical protein
MRAPLVQADWLESDGWAADAAAVNARNAATQIVGKRILLSADRIAETLHLREASEG